MSDFVANAETDLRWLRLYAEQADQAAFRSLVERYSGLVYGTAMRRTANAEWAVDITQNVFAALGSKASQLVNERIPSVGAWLHRAATLESKHYSRGQLNARRRKEMIHEELSLTDTQAQHEWNEVLPLLDEALEKLPSRDRDIIILHYFDGMNFREIAQHLGLRSDAAQKRSVRALDKLSRLLRTSGKPVLPAALIAAGLTTEFAQAAPSSLITKILTATNIAPSGAMLGTNITTMTLSTKTTLTGVATAFAILVAFIGGGYLIGNKARTTGSAAAPAIPDTPQTTDPAPEPEEVTLPPDAPIIAENPIPIEEVDDASVNVASVVARLEALGAERERLLTEARSAMRGGQGFEALRPFLIKVEAIHKEAEKELASLAGNFHEALAKINQGESSRTRDWVVSALFKSWGQSDPNAALTMAESLGKSATKGAYQGWGSKDPEAALSHQQSVAAQDQSAGREALLRIFDGWVSTDPMEAMEGLQQLGFDEQKTAFKAFDDALQSESLRSSVLAAVAQVDDESLRADLVSDVCKNWGRMAPDDARTWFDSLAFENPRVGIPAAQEILKGFAASGRMAEGADWIWPKLPQDSRPDFVADVIVGEWATSDRDAASAWLRAHGMQSALTNP